MSDLEKVKDDYGTDSIDSLEGLSAIRKRPGMYIGSTSQRGINHLIWEVADNSVDEFVGGHGQDIWITVKEDGTVIVKDNGRGIPVGPHKKWKKEDGTPLNTLTGLFTKIHAGGKFGGSGGGYKVSAGLHGVGIKAVNALSDYCSVEVRKGGQVWKQEFSKGEPTTEDPILIGKYDEKKELSGTTITYHPDKEIFKQTLLPDCKAIQARVFELASLNAGLKFHYKNEITEFEQEYIQHDGIAGYARRLTGEKPLLYDNVVYIKDSKDVNDRRILVEISFIHDDDENGNDTIKTFANNINTHEGGFHLDGFRTAYRKCLNKYGADKKIIKENLSIKYLLEGLNAVVSVRVPEAEFEGQTKTKLGNAEVEGIVEEIFTKHFEELSKETTYDAIFESIVLKSLKAKEADEAARKARSLVKAGNKVKKLALPGKLADCNPKSPYSELYIVEGDSAGGCFPFYTKIALADGRDLEIGKVVEEFQQGKTNYVYSSTLDGEVGVFPILDAFKTKENAEIIEITLDNGEKLRCTPDHRFMLRDGSYKEAQHLTEFDSLMPLYRKYSSHPFMHGFYGDRYEYTYVNKFSEWIPTHRLVAKQYLGEKKIGYHTHHIDINSRNNTPNNLEYVDATEHLKFHAELNKLNGVPEKISKTVTKYFEENPQARKHLAEKAREQIASGGGVVASHRKKMKEDQDYFERNWRKLHSPKATENRSKALVDFFQKNPQAKEHLSNKAKEQWEDESLRNWRAEKTKEQMNNPENRKQRKETMMKNRIMRGLGVVSYMLTNNISINKRNYSDLRKQQDRSKFVAQWDLLIEKIGNEEEIINQAKLHNHKIVKIEWIEEKVDVYDITVPPYSNFALSSGVFVHNSAKQGRSRDFQAILALRGKLLNTEKGSLEKLLKSETITNIIAAVGTGIDAPGQKFDLSKLRYDKIVIMTDSDVDGSHIKTLILTLFFNYMRPLIEEGYVYCAQPPLYRVQSKKGEAVYLKDDHEKKDYMAKHKNVEIQRFKG